MKTKHVYYIASIHYDGVHPLVIKHKMMAKFYNKKEAIKFLNISKKNTKYSLVLVTGIKK